MMTPGKTHGRVSTMRVRLSGAVALLLLATGPALADETPAVEDWSEARFADRFAPLDWLIGEWQGYGQFAKRTGFIHKRYEYEVAGMYLVERTLDMFPPPEATTDFEIHQDFTVLSRHSTGAVAAHGFFVEGFVTTATVTVAESQDSFVVESESIANGPPGMRSRFTYTRTGPDAFTLRFELASPGKEYRQVEEATMRRIR